MSNLNVALFQLDLIWEDPQANRKKIQELLAKIPIGQHDLIVFPEMYSTGFSMTPDKLAEPMDGPTVQWMQTQAANKNAVLAGSLIIQENGQFFNRLVFAFPNQTLAWYDKRHLFTLAGEHNAYTPGNRRDLVDINGWKIMPQICYDLRFPSWARNNLDYDLLLYVANWPKPRHHAWQNLLLARAIENQAYVIGVNRWGSDANGLEYIGGSAAIDYTGERLLEITKENSQSIVLEKESMYHFRSKLNFLADQDDVQIKV